jgi:F-type H+-transporting ATPase subunit b
MDETLRQLGGLLLGAIPTVILLLFIIAAYRVLVHRPLERVLTERHERTEGAVERARADIAAAEAKTAEYEQRMREARATIFKAQEARRHLLVEQRAALLAEARSRAQKQVEEARAALQRDKVATQSSLQGEAQRLAAEIIRALLRPAATAPNPQAGGRP